MKVYIVEGEVGECYEDRREWIVAAYSTEELAKEHRDKATACVLKLNDVVCSETRKALDEIDPKKPQGIDYTSVEYYYYSVEVYESIAEALDKA